MQAEGKERIKAATYECGRALEAAALLLLLGPGAVHAQDLQRASSQPTEQLAESPAVCSIVPGISALVHVCKINVTGFRTALTRSSP